MSQHLGILGVISEASEIKEELSVSAEEAFAIQRERAAERLKQYEAANEPPTNVLQFRPR